MDVLKLLYNSKKKEKTETWLIKLMKFQFNDPFQVFGNLPLPVTANFAN